MLRTRGVNAESVLHAELPQPPPEAVPGGTQDRAFSLCGQGPTIIDYVCFHLCIFFPGPLYVDYLLTCIYAT